MVHTVIDLFRRRAAEPPFDLDVTDTFYELVVQIRLPPCHRWNHPIRTCKRDLRREETPLLLSTPDCGDPLLDLVDLRPEDEPVLRETGESTCWAHPTIERVRSMGARRFQGYKNQELAATRTGTEATSNRTRRHLKDRRKALCPQLPV